MKTSIRNQFALIFIGLMAGIVIFCLLINNIWLGRYYMESKKKVIFDAYHMISTAAKSDSYGTESFVKDLDRVCRKDNITICIVDHNSQMRYSSENGGRELESRLLGYIFGFFGDHENVLEAGDDYIMQITTLARGEYVEMYGRLDTGISFIMQTPLESIKESAAIANRFFVYVGIVGTLVGGIIIWLVSRRITKPILELSDISRRMVEFDFEAKYQGKAQNEIALLGQNINILSETLEETISDLKTANNELKRDIEKKEQIDEMRKEFLSNVSHELKTPIALIQGYAEGLREGIHEDAESREFYCEVIMDEAAKMNAMVQKLLSLNELEFGKEVVTMERFDLTALVKGCLQSAEILTAQKGITIKIMDYLPMYVWGDELKIEEVFMNYLSNAINHCSGDKIIEIKFIPTWAGARIQVFNTGDTIPEDALPFIWDKFYKVDKARSREYGGTGVGLSIVKAIMESMNRRYGVENCANGVCFWFELELA